MRRLDSDLLELLLAASKGELAAATPPVWSDAPVANIVLAAKGYPGSYAKNSPLKGIDAANLMGGVQVFHAGTKRTDEGQLISSGGRVLNITAEGKSIEQAVQRAYNAIDNVINWQDGFCRRDIAKQALEK